MRLVGRMSNTGQILLSAYVISPKHQIYKTIVFMVDTGASESLISPADAERIGIDFEKLHKGESIIGIGGVAQSYILDDVTLFVSAEERGVLYARHFDAITIFPKSSSAQYEMLIPSILGRDFLGNEFSIQVDAKARKVYLVSDNAPTQRMPETTIKEMLDPCKADQKAFLDTFSFVSYPADFVRELCFYLQARLREFFVKKPTHEKEILDEIEKLLIARGYEYGRENVTFQFGPKRYIPDFNFPREETVLEAKLCKSQEKMKKIAEEIQSDIAAYNTRYKHQVFIVYDLGVIRHPLKFKQEIEKMYTNVVIIVIKD